MAQLITPFKLAKEIINDMMNNPERYRLNVRNKESPLVITQQHIMSYLQEREVYLSDEEFEKLLPRVMMYLHDLIVDMGYEIEKKHKKIIIYGASEPAVARETPKSLKTPAEKRFFGGSE